MTRKCKTPAKVRELINCHMGYVDHVDEMIRVKTTVPVENQAEHVRSKSVDFMEGMAVGFNQMLEAVLFEHNCYAGYMNVGHKQSRPDEGPGVNYWSESVEPSHPDYADWRRHYFTRGV